MSFGIKEYEAYSTLAGTREGRARLDPAVSRAFETQMRMAQSLFGEHQDSGAPMPGYDNAIMSDPLMMDALSTISQLMRDEAGMAGRPAAAAATPSSQPDLPSLGALSAQFESGKAGIGAIGYDRTGGTSYGKYQLASKVGSMDRFLTYLDQHEPAWAERLRQAGPANTGSKTGGMPEVWQAIASESPARFEKLQHDFISESTYRPARNMILDKTGLDFDNAPPALREVLWSTSVQHGPTGASNIFSRVISSFLGKAEGGELNRKIIEGVYDSRGDQFGSSTARVRRSVQNRLTEEKQLALNMLGKQGVNRMV